jgi:hypothetical protein
MKKRKKAEKNDRAIRRIAELLSEVMDSFEEYGIGTTTVQLDEEENAENANEEEEEEFEEEPQFYFNPEDVQIAVDQAISTLINEKLIKEFRNPKEPPSLTAIFAILFGDNSELTQQVDYFEDLISGYNDLAHVDDLTEAHGILESIVDELTPDDEE